MSDLRELAACAEDAAVRAGALLVRPRSSNAVHVSTKAGSNELVTSADLASNDLIRDVTRRATPAAQYFSEEGEERAVDWRHSDSVVDPLDGTVSDVYERDCTTRVHAHFARSRHRKRLPRADWDSMIALIHR